MTRTSVRAPWYLLLPGLLAILFLGLPLVGLLIAAPWTEFGSVLSSPNALSALRLSLLTATLATAVSLAFGVPLAWLLAYGDRRWTRWARPLVLIPLVLPPVIGGVTLLMAFGRNGLFGRYLYSWFGVQLPFSTAGVVVAEAFVAMPFIIITVEAALRTLDPRFNEAARTLGGSSWTVLRRVTLPMITPALVAGAVLCWARALGEFGATITFAGNFPGVTQTLPLAVYSALEVNRAEAIGLSIVLLGVCVVVLVALRDRYLRTGV